MIEALHRFAGDESGSLTLGMGLGLGGSYVGPLSAYYSANGKVPGLIADYANQIFSADGASVTTFAALHTVSTTGPGTVIDSDGLLKWRPMNSIPNPNAFNSWTQGATTAAANDTVAPDGTTTADTITENTANAIHRISTPPMTVPSGEKHKIVVWVLKSSNRRLYLNVDAILGAKALFNLTDGAGSVVAMGGAAVDLAATIVADGTFYKCTLTGTGTGASNAVYLQLCQSTHTTATDETYTGDGTSGLAFWRAHGYAASLGGMQDNDTSYPQYNDGGTSAYYHPGFDYNPSTLAAIGPWMGPARTQMLLNTETLSTQSVTTTNVAHTLHFTGTGTITLTGASTAGPLVGTGTGESNRVSLTFTPTAGSLTLTVSGTVTRAQLEIGATKSPYIPATGATVTRPKSNVTILDSAFTFNATEGVLLATYISDGYESGNNGQVVSLGNAAGVDGISLARDGATADVLRYRVVDGSVDQVGPANVTSVTDGAQHTAALGYKLNDFAVVVDATTKATDVTGTLPVFDHIGVGQDLDALNQFTGHVQKIVVYRDRLAV